MTAWLQLLLDHNVRIGVCNVRSKWIEVDTPQDRDLHELSLESSRWLHDWRF